METKETIGNESESVNVMDPAKENQEKKKHKTELIIILRL